MKNNRYILPFVFVSLLSGACHRDYLTPVPQTQVTDATAFSTAGRIQNQVLSLYGALKSGSWMGGRYQIGGDIKGDNFINEQNNLITGADVWAGNPTNSATAVVNEWSAAYLCINNANLFIDGMSATGTAVVGAALGGNYIAEAKVVRATAYYGLLQYYAKPYAMGVSNPGVPLRLTGIKQAGFSALARSRVDSCYLQVIKDLDEAEASLPASYSSALLNTTHAHKNTAIALKTRVYLSMGLYDKVISEANKIVSATAPFVSSSGVAFSLAPDITKVFVSPYTLSESIFSLPMSSTSGDNPGTQNQLGFYFSPSSAQGGIGGGEYSMNPNGVIADANWKSTDARRNFVFKSPNGKFWCTKYKAPSPYTDFAPIIRYAEVLLNLAEARVRSTNSVDAQAVALLNAVRQRSDATTTFTAGSFANPAALVAAILQEKNIEFFGEGLRNNDLVRLQMTIPAKGSAGAKLPTDPGYIWPISASEISLNPLCTDN